MQIANGTPADWGSQIRRFRRQRALKQMALADYLGVDQTTISRWESGQHIPDLAMQRRLRTLIRSTPTDEVLLKHWIATTVNQVVLATLQRQIFTASPPYAKLHGVPLNEIMGMSTRHIHTEESERMWRVSYGYGFFRGDIASVAVVGQHGLLSDPTQITHSIAVWTPVRLSDGKFVLRSERSVLTDEQYAHMRVKNGGPIRIVTMDDLCR
ncbi:MAG: helix-turn-helix transcriptional regulator [Rhodospirillales bacterium]|nr:helix-turn-helix transcriptional regulator [Rhodospirillales bacterium]